MIAQLATDREFLYQSLGRISEIDPFLSDLVSISKEAFEKGGKF